jgi:hypothetical protein
MRCIVLSGLGKPAMIDWSIEATTFGNCNCDYGCPCQFEQRPSRGFCQGFEAGQIDSGYFADVRLDGLCYAVLYDWPGPIYEGNGTMQMVIDERADQAQRNALTTVLSGGETEEAKTHWWVYRAMSTTVHQPIVKPIEFRADVERRSAHVSIPGILESSGRPIVSPATGEDHRVRIDIPDGIEFEIAEIGSASTRASGAIAFDLKDSYGQFGRIHHNGRGVVRTRK